MKKLITLILLLTSLFVTTFIYAGDVYEYEWSNTYVTVSINDDLSKYTNKPTAVLKKNNALLNNAMISYDINGDWLYYLKDVDTTRVGEYKVWYKAKESRYNPGHCKNYKSLVTFKVVDNISKIKINVLGDYNEELGAKVCGLNTSNDKVNLIEKGIINIISKYEYKYTIDDSNVKYSKPGRYIVRVYVIDSRNVEANETFYIDIIDTKDPVANPKQELVTIERNDKINWEDYIKVEDDIVDKYEYITNDFDVNIIDKRQEVSVKIIDSSGNYTIIKINILIKDTIKPQITLKNDKVSLDYNTSYDQDFFLSYLESATDGPKDITKDVKVDLSGLDKLVGSYKVKFYVYDDDNNYTESFIECEVLSKVPPIITASDATIKVNEEINIKDYVTVIDESDPDLINKIDIDPLDFNNKVPGTYFIKIFATNSSQMSTHAIMKITVVDDKVEVPVVKIIAGIGVIAILVGYLIYKRKVSREPEVDDIGIDT